MIFVPDLTLVWSCVEPPVIQMSPYLSPYRLAIAPELDSLPPVASFSVSASRIRLISATARFKISSEFASTTRCSGCSPGGGRAPGATYTPLPMIAAPCDISIILNCVSLFVMR